MPCDPPTCWIKTSPRWIDKDPQAYDPVAFLEQTLGIPPELSKPVLQAAMIQIRRASRPVTGTNSPMTMTEIAPLVELDPWPVEECIRTAGGVRYLVPPSPEWADWQDDNAIRRQGVRIGASSPARIRREIRAIAVLDAWDNQLPSDQTKRVRYSASAQFALLHRCSVDLD